MPADSPRATPLGHAALTRLLERFTEIAATVYDARELTHWLLSQISDLAGWPVAHALLVDPHGAVTMWFSRRTSETRWEGYVLATSGLAMRTSTGLIDRVIATRRPGWVTDIGAEAAYPRAAAAHAAGLRGVFAFPVIRNDRVVALLQFLSPQPIEPDVDLLEATTIAGCLLGDAVDRLRAGGESDDQPSRLHRIVDAGTGAFFAIDRDGRITEWTRSAERLFGWARTEAMHRRGTDLLLWHRHATTPQSIPEQSRPDGSPTRQPVRTLYRRDGSMVAVEVTRWRVPSASGSQIYFFCRDISESEQRAAGNSLDPLTGLLNRAGLLDALAARLAERHVDASGSGNAANQAPVLFLIGLQRFKEIDYSHDHHRADEALRVIGKRLAAIAHEATPQPTAPDAAPGSTTPSGPLVARVAGDEFAVILETSGVASNIAAIAEQIVDAISVPFQAADRLLTLTAHVGAATPMLGGDVRSWFGDADAALYRSRHGDDAQRGIGARFEIEGFARRQGGSWRQSLPTEIRVALHDEQFELYFQPILALPGRDVAGAEALIRWHHPRHGLLLPGAFITAAEESGLIAPLGEWVLQTAAAQAHAWQRPSVRVAVNLSGAQLADPGIVALVEEAARLHDVPNGGGLVLEMTESLLMADPAVAATRIGQFRDMGVQISIDDFGTGYSSLAYLKWFDIDIIKIDMSFVHGMESSRTDAAIVRAIIDLARELDIIVVGEGVETEAQLERLEALGCARAQGFHIGRPGPAADFIARLSR